MLLALVPSDSYIFSAGQSKWRHQCGDAFDTARFWCRLLSAQQVQKSRQKFGSIFPPQKLYPTTQIVLSSTTDSCIQHHNNTTDPCTTGGSLCFFLSRFRVITPIFFIFFRDLGFLPQFFFIFFRDLVRPTATLPSRRIKETQPHRMLSIYLSSTHNIVQ